MEMREISFRAVSEARNKTEVGGSYVVVTQRSVLMVEQCDGLLWEME